MNLSQLDSRAHSSTQINDFAASDVNSPRNVNFYKSTYSAQVHGAEFPAGRNKIIAGEVKQLLPSQGHEDHVQF